MRQAVPCEARHDEAGREPEDREGAAQRLGVKEDRGDAGRHIREDRADVTGILDQDIEPRNRAAKLSVGRPSASSIFGASRRVGTARETAPEAMKKSGM